MNGDLRLTRRAVVLGALAGAVAACRPHHSRSTSPHRPVTPADDAALRQAIADEEALLQTLLRLAAAGDVRETEQRVHAAHLSALHHALAGVGATVSATPTAPGPSETATAHGQLPARAFDRQRAGSARRLRTLAVAAARGSDAALLASISACHSAPEASEGAQLFGAQQ